MNPEVYDVCEDEERLHWAVRAAVILGLCAAAWAVVGAVVFAIGAAVFGWRP